MAEELGVAELRITINDQEARAALDALRRQIDGLNRQAATAAGGRGSGGRAQGGARESVDALQKAQERRFRLALRIEDLERKGSDVSRLRTRLGELTEAQSRRQFGTVRQISQELAKQITLEERRLRLSEQNARTAASAVSRGARQGGAAESIDALQKAQERRFRLAQRIDRLEQSGADVSRLRGRLGDLTEATANRQFGTQRQISTELSRQVRLAEARLRIDRQQQQQLTRLARLGGPSSPVNGGVNFPGSPAFLAAQIRAGGPSSPIGGSLTLAGSPAALRAEQRLAAARERATEAAKKAAEAEGRRIGRLNTSPVRGGAAFPGSPAFFESIKPPRLPNSFFNNPLSSSSTRAFSFEDRLSKARAKTAAETAKASRQEELASSRRRESVVSNALIGGAFPLLFGQGLGASIGGSLGGGLGGLLGGTFGFGGSLVGTAIGAQFDAATQNLQLLSKALNDPIGQFSALQQSALLSSRGLERNVESLISVGREAEAAAIIQADLATQFESFAAAQEYSASVDQFNRSFAQLGVELGRLGIEPLTGAAIDLAAALSGLRTTIEQLSNFKPPGLPDLPGLPRAGQTGSAFFNPLSPGFGVSALIEGFKGLSNLFGGGQASRPGSLDAVKESASELEAIDTKRSSLLSTQFRLISAQEQGYKGLVLQRKQELLIAQEAVELDNLRARLGSQFSESNPQVQALRERFTLERFRLSEQQQQLQKIEQAPAFSSVAAIQERLQKANESLSRLAATAQSLSFVAAASEVIRLETSLSETQGTTARVKASLLEAGIAAGDFRESLNNVQSVLQNLEQYRATLDIDSTSFKTATIDIIATQEQLRQLDGQKALIEAQFTVQGLQNGLLRPSQASFEALGASLQSALQAAPFDSTAFQALRDASIQAQDALEAGANRLQFAAIGVKDAGEAIAQGGRSAAAAIAGSSRNLRSLLQSNFNLLKPSTQRELIADARRRIDFRLVDRNALRSPGDFFAAADLSEKLTGNNLSLDNLNSTIAELTNKDWSVNVVVNSNGGIQAFGDTLNNAVGVIS